MSGEAILGIYIHRNHMMGFRSLRLLKNCNWHSWSKSAMFETTDLGSHDACTMYAKWFMVSEAIHKEYWYYTMRQDTQMWWDFQDFTLKMLRLLHTVTVAACLFHCTFAHNNVKKDAIIIISASTYWHHSNNNNHKYADLLLHTAISFHCFVTVSLWAQNVHFQKILSSTCSATDCFCLSDGLISRL